MAVDLSRRDVLRLGAAGVAGAALTACGDASSAAPGPAPRSGGRVLLAYFSRPGENYWFGGRRDLAVGNTAVLARMLRRRVRCDFHEIRAADPYSDAYNATVARNSREQDEDARPGIANPLRSIDRYDTIILASPLWNVRPPMIMRTFAERYAFDGKRVLPVVTYAVSGIGGAPDEYAEACAGASIGRGLAVRGERVRASADQVDAWVRRTRLPRRA